MKGDGLNTFLSHSVFFLCVFGFSILLYYVLLRFARTLGIRDKKDVIRWASSSKPALGGIIFYIIFLLSIVCHTLLFGASDVGLASSASLGALASVSLAFLMGLADDAYDTRPLLKFLVQLFCGGILIATGTCIDIFDNQIANVVLTLVSVIGIMNSINMLDNMDGITSVTSMFILLNGMVFLSLHGLTESLDFVIMLGIISTLVAFLFFNWNPSKMYMGDTGSQFLGMLLAVIGIRYFWNSTLLDGRFSEWQQVYTLLVAFALPIIDTTIVSINRVARKQSPFIGGKDHTTHNLSYLGMSDSQVALTFAGISVLNLFICYFIFRFLDVWSLKLGLMFYLYPMGIFVAFFVLCRRQRHMYTDQ